MPSERLGIPRALRRRAFLSPRQPYSDFALGASDDTTIVFHPQARLRWLGRQYTSGSSRSPVSDIFCPGSGAVASLNNGRDLWK